MSKPTIVALPGAYHTPEIYDQTFSFLKVKGYPTIGVALPSVNASPPKSSHQEDLDAIRGVLSPLIEKEGKDVVLVVHSYSGQPGADATQGLGKKEREAKGLKGGVVRIVFLMAFAQWGGFDSEDVEGFPKWMDIDFQKGTVIVSPEDAKKVFYNDMSSEEGDKWAATLRPQSLGVFTSKCEYPAWRDIPCTFVKASQDKCGLLDVVDFWIAEGRKLDPNAFDVIEECDGSHFMMLSQPEWVAGVLERAAGGK